MKLHVLAIGRLKAGPERVLVDHYAQGIQKLGPQIGFTSLLLTEIDDRKAPKGAESGSWQAHAFTAKAARDARKIMMDESGRSLTSEQFARDLSTWRDSGVPEVAFLIGGADGHGDEIRAAADDALSLGAMTWPHLLARVLLLEQIYRAVTIGAGHPYHRS